MSPDELRTLAASLAPLVAVELSKVAAPLLSRSQLAQRFGVTVATIDRYVRKGMPVHHIGDKRFDASECLTWIDAHNAELDASASQYTLRARKAS